MSASKFTVPTVAEILAMPVTVPAIIAGYCHGIGDGATYQAIKEGTFPVPVLKLGRAYRCTRAALMESLGIAEPDPLTPGKALAMAGSAQVNGPASDTTSEARGSSRAA